MSERINEVIKIGGEEIEIDGVYGEEMAEKLKREANTMLFTNNYYCFGFDLWTGTKLASASKGVLP